MGGRTKGRESRENGGSEGEERERQSCSMYRSSRCSDCSESREMRKSAKKMGKREVVSSSRNGTGTVRGGSKRTGEQGATVYSFKRGSGQPWKRRKDRRKVSSASFLIFVCLFNHHNTC
jgi:hypothetical protein